MYCLTCASLVWILFLSSTALYQHQQRQHILLQDPEDLQIDVDHTKNNFGFIFLSELKGMLIDILWIF